MISSIRKANENLDCDITINDDKITIEDSRKYIRFDSTLLELYSYMLSDVNYPYEVFKMVVLVLETITEFTYYKKDIYEYYEIHYRWDGIVHGNFKLIIPRSKFVFDKDKIRKSIEETPNTNLVINHMNNILESYQGEEKGSRELQDIDEELSRFCKSLNVITQSNITLNKIARIYPYISIRNYHWLAIEYLKMGTIKVHSGEYVDTKHSISGFDTFHVYSSNIHKSWNCCPSIDIDIDRNGYFIIKLIDVKKKFMGYIYVPSKVIRLSQHSSSEDLVENFVIGLDKIPRYYCKILSSSNSFERIMDSIRGCRCKLMNYRDKNIPISALEIDDNSVSEIDDNNVSSISDTELSAFIADYGSVMPNSYCLNSKEL